jgi:hypothetical protein
LVKSPPISAGFEANAVLRPVEGALVHQEVVHSALGVTTDGEPVPRPKRAIADRDTRRGIRTTHLDHVVAVADVAVFNEVVGTAQVDAVGIGRRPSRRDAQPRGVNILHGAEQLNVEFR